MTFTADEYLDALVSLPSLYGARVSPDGRWVAWSWFRAGPAADVYVAPTDGSAKPVRLSDTADDTLICSWTPDSRSLVVEQDRDGNERVRLYRIDLDRPLVMTPLTEPEPDFFIQGGQLHPNGRWLIYGANVDATSGAGIEPTWLYRHDLETGERRILARPVRPGSSTFDLNHEGTHILYSRKDRHAAGVQMWLVDIEGAGDHEILNAGDERKVDASWFPDGRSLLILGETPTHMRLGVWEMETESTRWLIDEPSRNIEDAYVPYGSERAVVIEARDAAVRASLLDTVSGEEAPLPRAAGNLLPLAPAHDGQWIGEYYSAKQPVDLVRFSVGEPDPDTFVSLTRIWARTKLTQDDLAAAEDVRWRAPDGIEIQGWLYRAGADAKGTIVFVHGGPTAHSEDRINNQIQYFVRSGFHVLDPNYRGSTGFSLAFRESIKLDGWGAKEQEDIRAGIETLIADGVAKEGRVGITGTSYGGYTSWHAITHLPPELIAAAAPICGMTDLVVDYETTRPDLRPYSEEMLGGRPDQAPERYHARSPIHFVSNIRGRLLIVQGAQDPNVTPANVRAVRDALDRAGVAYEVLIFEDEGHGISRPANQRVLLHRLAEFFTAAFAGA